MIFKHMSSSHIVTALSGVFSPPYSIGTGQVCEMRGGYAVLYDERVYVIDLDGEVRCVVGMSGVVHISTNARDEIYAVTKKGKLSIVTSRPGESCSTIFDTRLRLSSISHIDGLIDTSGTSQPYLSVYEG